MAGRILFSDLHGNIEKLQALLERRAGRQVICLGDALGRGDNQATLEKLKESKIPCLKGNHEVDLLPVYRPGLTPEQLDWVKGWPHQFVEGDVLLTHTWLDDHHFRRIESPIQVELFLESHDFRVAFVGHSHSPGYWHDGKFHIAEPGTSLTFQPGSRYVIDVGSLGEPLRTLTYVDWDDDTVVWHTL